jgi:hypothetical protein
VALFHIQTRRPDSALVPKEDVMSPRRTKKAAGALSPLLALLISALEEQASLDSSDEARALRAFGELAVKQIPTRGLFAPMESELDRAIDQIAKGHLGLKTPRKEFFKATATVEPFAKRDEIESAANHVQTVSDHAHFYAGLAFGITLVDFRAIR